MPLPGVCLTECQPDPKHNPMSWWPYVVLLLATRCLYCGVHLTECQPDPKHSLMSWWPDIVLLLTTRCLSLGVPLTVICHLNCIPLTAEHLMSKQMTVSYLFNCIPQNVKLTLHSTALYHQMPLLGVHLTESCLLNCISWKCQADLM